MNILHGLIVPRGLKGLKLGYACQWEKKKTMEKIYTKIISDLVFSLGVHFVSFLLSWVRTKTKDIRYTTIHCARLSELRWLANEINESILCLL